MKIEYHLDEKGECHIRGEDSESSFILEILEKKAPEVLRHMIRMDNKNGYGSHLFVKQSEELLNWVTFDPKLKEEKQDGTQ